MPPIQVVAVRVRQSRHEFFLTKMPAAHLVAVSYASVRGQDHEAGAVQRLLSPRRIASLKDYALSGGDYPNSVVLNWIDSDNPTRFAAGKLTIPFIKDAAQIIDGQHRIAGLDEAIRKKKAVGKMEIPVAIYLGLNTRECADIFLAINTEQRAVPRSLVFDLYAEASSTVVDPAALRARDVAMILDREDDSPLFARLRYPGAEGGKRSLPLSTAATSLKPLVEEDGELEQVGIHELEMQKRVVANYYQVIRDAYGPKWDDPQNPFVTAAGFVGAIEFLRTKLIPHCNLKKSFTQKTMSVVLTLPSAKLLRRDDLKSLQGRKSRQRVFDFLERSYSPPSKESEDIEI
jgi:DGQHR domain-containing protein